MEEEKYRILIADDEYWTREKLRRMIDWEKYSLEFLEPAVDGEDVLRKMEELHPDIVITDINMPYLDGVELLKILNDRYPEVVTFVVSGYDDFELVRESFMAGSINYLVKPVSRIDLITAVSKALEMISERKKRREETLRMSSYLQDMEFSQLLEKQESPFMAKITITGSLDFAGVTLIMLKIHSMKELSRKYHYDRNLLSRSVKKKLQSILEEETAIIFNHVYRSNEFIMVSSRENMDLRRLSTRICREMEEEAVSPVSLVFSDHSFSVDSIHQAYVQTVSLLMSRAYRPVSQIIFPDSNGALHREISSRFSEQHKLELGEYLKRKDAAGARTLIAEEIGLAHAGELGWQYLEVRQTIKRLVNFIQEYCIDAGETQDFEAMAMIMDKELDTLDIRGVCELLEELIGGCLSGGAEMAGTMKETVRQAEEYVRQHYFEPLSLGMLAEKYHVDSSYLSRMFRKETGVNLIQFITRTRIDRAKELIRRGRGNLTEIAFMVGYDDYTNFNKVFRRLEGCSPSEYRKHALERAAGPKNAV